MARLAAGLEGVSGEAVNGCKSFCAKVFRLRPTPATLPAREAETS